MLLHAYATVAQLVEQLIRNQQVAGSSPASSSIQKRKVFKPSFFYKFLLLIRIVPVHNTHRKLLSQKQINMQYIARHFLFIL